MVKHMQTIWILALAFLGFVDLFYISWKKKKKQKLVCVLGSDCNKVINSSYASLFGVDNTKMGMIYYALLFFFVLMLPFTSLPFIVTLGLFFMSVAAALTSVYLLVIQLFVLKEQCDYCLVAALINILLFLLLSP
jgi:uncharacterized membrane protein